MTSWAFAPGGPLSNPNARVTPAACGRQRCVGLLTLALGLRDEGRREIGGEPVREIVERRERRDQHDSVAGHPAEQVRCPMQAQPVLDRIDVGLDRHAGAGEPFGVGRHPKAHPMGLVDDGVQLLAGHLGRFRILALDGPGASRHDLDVVRAAADLFANSPAHLPRAVGFLVHRAEDPSPGGGRRDDPAARQNLRPIDELEPDRLAEDDRLVVVAPDVANRREPGPKQGPGGLGEDKPAELGRARLLALQRWRRPETGAPLEVAHDVHVGIDQAGKHGPSGDVAGAVRRGRASSICNVCDQARANVDRDVFPRWAAAPVKEAGIPEQEIAGDGHSAIVSGHSGSGASTPQKGRA
jgi:hypothetical protein